MASDQIPVYGNTVTCPCKKFATLVAVRAVLESEQQTRTLIEWLSLPNENQGRDDQHLPRLSCLAPGLQNILCPNRYATSFFILNGIRDACRPYLETSTTVKSTDGFDRDSHLTTGAAKTQPTYEESFPPLSAEMNATDSTPVAARKNPKKKVVLGTTRVDTTSKRRIRPAPAIISSASVWGSSSAGASGRLKGNISVLPSEEPFPLGSAPDRQAILASSPAKWPKAKPDPVATIPTEELDKTRELRNSPVQECKPKVVLNQLGRLAEVHATLVLNQLVPSTAMEIHFLIRLLVATDMTPLPSDAEGLFDLFISPSECREFAVAALKRLACILRNLDLFLLDALVLCPPIQNYLSELQRELQEIAQQRRRSMLLEGSYLSNGTDMSNPFRPSPMITLPFDHERDSRHNYTSKDDMMLYKNREESRDSFLYQLRAFQNVRGKVLDVTAVERSIDRIRVALRAMIRGLHVTNMVWFSELFCELLLQIGLVPMEETDKDLLKIIGREKLQKLHKRFSSKNEQANKSSRTLIFDQSKGTTSKTPIQEAQRCFPGHQEFFFIFIVATDSYNLSHNLKLCLRTKLIQLEATVTDHDIGKRILHLRLLSKFLGLLVFLPNWYTTRSIEFHVPSVFGEEQLDACLPLVKILVDAWKMRNLSSTVPWMIEYLRMSHWDSSFQSSPYNQKLLAFLAGIYKHQRIVSLTSLGEPGGVNAQRLSLYLEAFFSEAIGMDKAAYLPLTVLPLQTAICTSPGETRQQDTLSLSFLASELSPGIPHLDELHTLVTDLTREVKRVQTVPRKLRPNAMNEKKAEALSSQPLFPGMALNVLVDETAVDATIHDKLKTAFFHQHRELKDLCEFTVGRLTRNAVSEANEYEIRPFLDTRGCSSPQDGVKRKAIVLGRKYIHDHLTQYFRQSFDLLCSREIQNRVKAIALSFAISQGLELAENKLGAMVEDEIGKRELSLAKDASTNQKEKATVAKIAQCLNVDDWDYCHQEALSDLIRLRSGLPKYSSGHISQEDMNSIDRNLVSFLLWSAKPSEVARLGDRCSIAIELLRTAAALRHNCTFDICSSFMAHLSTDEALMNVLQVWLADNLPDHYVHVISSALVDALDVMLIAPSILERVLLRAMETDGNLRAMALAIDMLEHFDDRKHNTGSWMFERLRFRLASLEAKNEGSQTSSQKRGVVQS